MAVDVKKHTSPAAGELPSRAALAAGLLSINDIIPVANTTEANQVAAAVAATGQSLATKPVTVSRADARGLHRVEYSYDGSVWIPLSGVLSFASKAAADTWGAANSALLSPEDVCTVGSDRYVWLDNAWVLTTARAIVRRAASQSLPSGNFSVITMDTVVDTNPSSMWAVGQPSRVVAPATALYLVTGGGGIIGGGAGRVAARILKNGTAWPVGGSLFPTGAAVDAGAVVHAVIPLAKNDYVELSIFQDTGAARNTGSPEYSSPHLSVALLSW